MISFIFSSQHAYIREWDVEVEVVRLWQNDICIYAARYRVMDADDDRRESIAYRFLY